MSALAEPAVHPFDTNLSRTEMVERYWRFQDDEPVARVRTAVGDQAWLVTRYEDVKALLGDRRLGRSHPDPDNAPRWIPSPLIGGPVMDFATEMTDRSALRKVLAGSFSPGRVAALRPLAEAAAKELLDAVAAGPTPADCLSTYAAPLPRRATSAHLGIAPGDADLFTPAANVLTECSAEEARQATAAMGSLDAYVTKLIAAKRANPAHDVLTDLIRACDEHGQLDERQLLFVTLVLLLGANGSTTTRINLAVALLLAHPEQYQAMVGDPTLVPGAVEEILRVSAGIFDSALRYARTDFEVHNVLIRTGDLLLLDMCAAHCDPRVFPDPLTFDITRKPNRHISFGHGFTRCIGATIARLNLEVAIDVLARRCPTLPFALPPTPPDRPLAAL
jgi:pentalenolactone synthase